MTYPSMHRDEAEKLKHVETESYVGPRHNAWPEGDGRSLYSLSPQYKRESKNYDKRKVQAHKRRNNQP